MRQLIRWIRRGGLVVALTIVTACGSAQPAIQQSPSVTVTPAGATVPEVVITAKEYSFAGPESIPGGWIKVVLDNQGTKSHDLILFKLEQGKSMDDVKAALDSQEPPDWITIFGQSSAAASTRQHFIVNLAPGNYAMISFGDEEGGLLDAARGMVKELTITEAPAV
jgi:hypothetical protein